MFGFDRDTNHHIHRMLQILGIAASAGFGVLYTLNGVLILLVRLWCHNVNAAFLRVSLDGQLQLTINQRPRKLFNPRLALHTKLTKPRID